MKRFESKCSARLTSMKLRSTQPDSTQPLPVPTLSNADRPRKAITYKRYPKLGVVMDVTTHFIIAFETGRGPYPDVGEFKGLIQQAAHRVKLRTVLADAGYDSEANHKFAREEMLLRTIIPPKHGRPTKKPATGRYRRLMQTRFDKQKYRKRAQVETVMSMIKRRQGSYCKGKSYWSRCRELNLMVLTHNIMILLPMVAFLQSRCVPFVCPYRAAPSPFISQDSKYFNSGCHASWL